MKKTVLLLIVLLYMFGVILRIVGSVMNGDWLANRMDWKSILTLGELDGTQDYGTRWKVRIAIMILLPFVWVAGLGKQIGKWLT